MALANEAHTPAVRPVRSADNANSEDDMRSSRILMWTGLAVLLVVASGPASADLIGDTVGSSITPSPLWASVPTSAIVGAGPEFSLQLSGSGEFFSVDLSGSAIQLNFTAPGGLGMGAGEVYSLTDLDWVGSPSEIVGFGLTLSGGITGFDASDISFTADSVTMVLNESSWQSGTTYARIDLRVRPIPEPAALALLGAGLAGLYLAGRRRRTAA